MFRIQVVPKESLKASRGLKLEATAKKKKTLPSRNGIVSPIKTFGRAETKKREIEKDQKISEKEKPRWGGEKKLALSGGHKVRRGTDRKEKPMKKVTTVGMKSGGTGFSHREP